MKYTFIDQYVKAIYKEVSSFTSTVKIRSKEKRIKRNIWSKGKRKYKFIHENRKFMRNLIKIASIYKVP